MRAKTLLLGSMSLVLAHCAGFKDLVGIANQKPKVILESMELAKVGLRRTELRLGLLVKNPNWFAINLEDLRYSVRLKGTVLGEGVFREALSLPGKQQTRVKLPVTLHTSKVLSLASKFLLGQDNLELSYRAEAVFASPVGRFDVATSGVQAVR